MSYTDVTNPVIINVTQSSIFSLENPLRQMAIVSNGNSKVTTGDTQFIDISNYSEIITKNTDTEKQVSSFFGYAGKAQLLLIEVGKDTKESQVSFLKNFLLKEEIGVYNIMVPPEWYYPYEKDKTYTATLKSTVLKPTLEEQTLNLETNIPLNNIEMTWTRDKGDVVKLDLNTKKFKLVESKLDSDLPVVAILKNNITGKDIGALTFNPQSGNTDSSIEYREETTKKDTNFTKLLTEVSNFDHKNYFFIPYPMDEDPSISQNITYYKGLKAAHLVLENSLKENLSSVGTVVGITASNYFDIGSNMPASSLNYKVTKNFIPGVYTKTFKKSLINAPVSFISEIAGNYVVLNGLQADGQPWDYYYYWDFTDYRLKNKITSLLLSGANNPTAAVKFNQDGIDTIHINLVTELNLLKEWGVITDFAKGYDSTTNELQDSGDIICPNYYSYIASNPDLYKKEILSGISVYIQIGKFIRQVQMNVNLGA